jgi:hypothetical protein
MSISNIPNELIEKVMLYTTISPLHIINFDGVPTHNSIAAFPYICDITAAPWSLTHVCREWRMLATRYSALWIYPHVDIIYFHTGPLSAEAVALYLKQSHSRDLHIYFHLEAPLPCYEEASTALHLILESSCRWKSAFLETDLAVWPNILTICNHTPRLNYLKLRPWDIDGYNIAWKETDLPLIQEAFQCMFNTTSS